MHPGPPGCTCTTAYRYLDDLTIVARPHVAAAGLRVLATEAEVALLGWRVYMDKTAFGVGYYASDPRARDLDL